MCQSDGAEHDGQDLVALVGDHTCCDKLSPSFLLFSFPRLYGLVRSRRHRMKESTLKLVADPTRAGIECQHFWDLAFANK